MKVTEGYRAKFHKHRGSGVIVLTEKIGDDAEDNTAFAPAGSEKLRDTFYGPRCIVGTAAPTDDGAMRTQRASVADRRPTDSLQ